MRSLKQFFEFLNDVDFPYVVLRNFDNLPYSIELGHHSDLDLLVYDLKHFLEIIQEAVPEYPLPRVRYKIPIEDSFIYADVRHVGDGYYPTHFEENVLATREYWPEKHIWTPNYIHHQIALAYHAVHHKGAIAPEYRRFLGDGTVKELLEALKQSPIGWVEPKDPTVGQFNRYWKGATSAVEKRDGFVVKRQLGFMDYALARNEFEILSTLDDPAFPKAINYNEPLRELEIEDCGEPLSVDNLPEDWKAQLEQILVKLHDAKIMHRDIRPDNLMVKDVKIRLIDFGWAVNEAHPVILCEASEEKPILRGLQKIYQEPPSVLGFPYKPSDGFSDVFSMRAVMRHFEYLLEEREQKKCESSA